MTFTSETDFEDALVALLQKKGWEKDVLSYQTEQDLIQNWARILFENNRTKDRLDEYPLTDGEMQQILQKIREAKSPYNLNYLINGKTIDIVRDNINDKRNFGRTIDLKIYDRKEIAAGQSRYQIVRQPYFTSKKDLTQDGRGDLLLLINGMPVIHIELKKSGVSIEQAENQIQKYANRGYFTGLFSLIQLFVVMTPEETKYFANPGTDGVFNKDFFFHWADFNNDPVNDWKKVTDQFLSIPMAHQLIGFYTVPDEAEGTLKIMRSYQYYAASQISDKVAKMKWDFPNNRGGYIWHTTGSGKTMTSFKSAQLIANSNDADKVVFLLDRIELGTQSLREFQSYADPRDYVQETEDSHVLLNKLKSDDTRDVLIVSSIQKLSILSENSELKEKDIEKIKQKRLVFIIDECHRSTFGEMLKSIKKLFTNAVFFGFTGTPIFDDNNRNGNNTASIFGDELHRYSIADGIRDKNVLGFDVYQVKTFPDEKLRAEVALQQADAKSASEAFSDPNKRKIYMAFADRRQIPMATSIDKDGHRIKGIEEYFSDEQYRKTNHHNAVIDDILANWSRLSINGTFHAILATTNIPEALTYYRLFKQRNCGLRITGLFDPTIGNDGKIDLKKEDGLIEMLADYNKRYGQRFNIATYPDFKRDVASRLAHKDRYKQCPQDQQLDLLIVVNQMLTGYDSKWVNTLYLDKVLEYANVIQAFSRTNRLCGDLKPFGTIRYYRRPHTMDQNIKKAIELYSGNRPLGLFVSKLPEHIECINRLYDDIHSLFTSEGISDFSHLPESQPTKNKFGKLYRKLLQTIASAEIQGFTWNQQTYPISESKEDGNVCSKITKTDFAALTARFKELSSTPPPNQKHKTVFNIDTVISVVGMDLIDDQYMNERFSKYRKKIQENADQTILDVMLSDLHQTFASLSKVEQKCADLILHDIQCGVLQFDESKSFRDYITEYVKQSEDTRLHRFATAIGVNEVELGKFINSGKTEQNLNEYGNFDLLKQHVNRLVATEFLEKRSGKKVPPFKVNIETEKLLRDFILKNEIPVELEDN